jgi:hypothetical protein
LAVVAIVAIIFALIIVFLTGSAARYEISIYSTYPLSFWLLIITSLTLGIFILLIEAFCSRESNWWLMGLTIVMLSNSIIFLLPLFRGYFTIDNYGYGSTDYLQHIGFARDIQQTGHLGSPMSPGENFYPAVHILIVFLAYTTNVNIEPLFILSRPFFYAFYLVSLYLLAQKLTKNRKYGLLTIVFGSVPIFQSLHLVMIPMMTSFFLLPFLLFLYFSSMGISNKTPCYKISFLLLLLAMPFYHPINGGISLLIVFLSLIVSPYIYKILLFSEKIRNSLYELRRLHNWNPLIILFTSWFIWFSSFNFFKWNVVALYKALQGIGASESMHSLIFGTHIIVPKLPVTEWLIHTLKTSGAHILYLLLSAPLPFRLFILRKKDLPEQLQPYLVFLCLLYVIFLTAVPITFFFPHAIGFCRMLLYPIFASTFINGVISGSLLARKPRLALAITVTVVLITLPISILNIHSSPWVLRANPQVTHAEVQGMSWFLSHRNEELLIDQTFFNQRIMSVGLLGAQNIPSKIRTWEDSFAPDHFGYHKQNTYGSSYKLDRYFLSNTLSRIFYESILPRYQNSWRWTPEDFNRLERDPTVSRIYSNGDFEVFYVRGVMLT